jgi:hypothetical protein
VAFGAGTLPTISQIGVVMRPEDVYASNLIGGHEHRSLSSAGAADIPTNLLPVTAAGEITNTNCSPAEFSH